MVPPFFEEGACLQENNPRCILLPHEDDLLLTGDELPSLVSAWLFKCEFAVFLKQLLEDTQITSDLYKL